MITAAIRNQMTPIKIAKQITGRGVGKRKILYLLWNYLIDAQTRLP